MTIAVRTLILCAAEWNLANPDPGMVISFDGRADTDVLKGEAKIAIDSVGRSFSIRWIARRSGTITK